jgi:ABC-type nickel/cobalt efflux system permease component RcnA
LPAATALDGDWSLRRALSIALAVGIRPCTGALLVLLFSSAAGLYWAGVVSTFVMALGTALTVSAIAALAVGSRRLALRLAKSDTAWLGTIAMTLKAGAGALLVLVGLTLFWGTLHGGMSLG